MIKGPAADPDLHLMLTFAEHYPAGCCIPLYVPVIDAQAVGYIAHRQVGAPILDIGSTSICGCIAPSMLKKGLPMVNTACCTIGCGSGSGSDQAGAAALL